MLDTPLLFFHPSNPLEGDRRREFQSSCLDGSVSSGLQDIDCPGAVDYFSWDGQQPWGWPDSLGHCEPRAQVLDAEGSYMDGGWTENYEMGFEASDPGDQQRMGQLADETSDLFGLGLEPSLAWVDPLAVTHLDAWQWGGDQMELEISKENIKMWNEASSASGMQPLTLSAGDMTPSTNENQPLPRDEKSLTNDVPSRSVSSHRDITEEWICDFIDCGKSFTHCYKLNRHKKYHMKKHRCTDPSCVTRNVAFALRKDLERHQAKHNGRQFYCMHAGCIYASGGTEGGFTRKDNLRRHFARKH
ncbi:hypothetical protein BGZ60DRAFT_511912 [Tricladium varicosporioides]|nr:hypothetical protein BGZ60DRAFT_511912 [Hymenoscyphus varicosporioides]